MIYNAQQIGNNQLILNETVPDDSVLLAVLFIPCNNTSTNINGDKKAILSVTKCNGYLEVNFEGVLLFYEDLLDGLINFEDPGTWSVNLYHQLSTSNVDVNLATFLNQIQLQVIRQNT